MIDAVEMSQAAVVAVVIDAVLSGVEARMACLVSPHERQQDLKLQQQQQHPQPSPLGERNLFGRHPQSSEPQQLKAASGAQL